MLHSGNLIHGAMDSFRLGFTRDPFAAFSSFKKEFLSVFVAAAARPFQVILHFKVKGLIESPGLLAGLLQGLLHPGFCEGFTDIRLGWELFTKRRELHIDGISSIATLGGMPFGNFAVQSRHQLFYLCCLNVSHKLRVSVWEMRGVVDSAGQAFNARIRRAPFSTMRPTTVPITKSG